MSKYSQATTYGYLLWAVIMMLICLLLLYSDYYSFANEYFFVLITICFINSGLLFVKNIYAVYTILALLVCLYFYELFLALIQWWEAKDITKYLFLEIQGSLQNSGIYACYLVILFPLLHYVIFNMAREKLGIFKVIQQIRIGLFLLLLVLVCFLIFITQSRTAYVAFPLTILSYIIFNYYTIIKQWIFVIPKAGLIAITLTLLIGFSEILYLLFYMKQSSAMGRLIFMRISWDHIRDHLWVGTGIGRFTWYYPKWQAEYFEMHPGLSDPFYLIAGQSFIIFNEYVQWFKTVGILGTIITMAAFIRFFTIKNMQYKSLLIAVKLTVIAIMACGFTSYPLHVNIFLLLLGFCFSLAVFLSENNGFLSRPLKLDGKFLTLAIRVLPLIFLILATHKGIRSYAAFRQWKDNRFEFSNTVQQEDKMMSTLGNNGKFLTELGEQQDSSACQKAIVILERAKQYFISQRTEEDLINVYTESGMYDKAIKEAEWLSHYLPNRFRPQYTLMQLYRKINDTIAVKRVAHLIIEMPVKIPSMEVDEIKAAAKAELIDYFK